MFSAAAAGEGEAAGRVQSSVRQLARHEETHRVYIGSPLTPPPPSPPTDKVDQTNHNSYYFPGSPRHSYGLAERSGHRVSRLRPVMMKQIPLQRREFGGAGGGHPDSVPDRVACSVVTATGNSAATVFVSIFIIFISLFIFFLNLNDLSKTIFQKKTHIFFTAVRLESVLPVDSTRTHAMAQIYTSNDDSALLLGPPPLETRHSRSATEYIIVLNFRIEGPALFPSSDLYFSF